MSDSGGLDLKEKTNEITKDTHSSTNINVEPQVIEYISNPTKFIEELNIAKFEVDSKKKSVNEFIDELKNKLGLKEKDTLKVIFTNAERVSYGSYGPPQAFSINLVKSFEGKNKVLYGKDENGNMIYAKDRSMENFSNDKTIELFVLKGEDLVAYDTTNKIVYMSVEAAQIDALNAMNIVSTNPKRNKEIRADITEKEVYTKDYKKIKIYFIENIISGTRDQTPHDPVYKGRVQIAHTHGAENKDDLSKFHATEVFSPADILTSQKLGVPLSVATPGDSKYEYGLPKIYIYYPDTKEIEYLGVPKTYKDQLDTTKFKLTEFKNGVKMKMIKAPKR